MATIASRPGNQAPPLEGYDLYGENRPVVEAVAREGGGWADDTLRGLGRLLGGEPLELGRLANEHPPQLRTHDRFGNRIDEVEFHPAWHRLLGLGVEHALHAAPWRSVSIIPQSAPAFSCAGRSPGSYVVEVKSGFHSS